jgi:hypothetical protein
VVPLSVSVSVSDLKEPLNTIAPPPSGIVAKASPKKKSFKDGEYLEFIETFFKTFTASSEQREAFPLVNFQGEILKAKAWLLENASKRRTKLQSFLTNWFAKAQDFAGRNPNAQNQNSRSKPTPTRQDWSGYRKRDDLRDEPQGDRAGKTLLVVPEGGREANFIPGRLEIAPGGYQGGRGNAENGTFGTSEAKRGESLATSGDDFAQDGNTGNSEKGIA